MALGEGTIWTFTTYLKGELECYSKSIQYLGAHNVATTLQHFDSINEAKEQIELSDKTIENFVKNAIVTPLKEVFSNTCSNFI
jgi:hypothetical protein